VQISTLLSIKTGGCPEDCAYCPQSAQYDTGVRAEKLMALDAVLAEARAAKARRQPLLHGRGLALPKDRDLDQVCAMVEGVKALGLETCATLGMLTAPQARRLKNAGLDYYNHNLDTSPEFYGEIITTRTYQDRLDTLEPCARGRHPCLLRRHRRHGRDARGPRRHDRTLASLPVHPESVPINMLVRSPARRSPARRRSTARIRAHHRGRPHHHAASVVRLSAGREDMSEETQALCFLAGANSIFYGPKLLTTPNPGRDRDRELMAIGSGAAAARQRGSLRFGRQRRRWNSGAGEPSGEGRTERDR
jgi:biotin synthase